jgi:hypothetical protein
MMFDERIGIGDGVISNLYCRDRVGGQGVELIVGVS